MGMRVYHYRSVNRALEEIKKGTFHYSSQDELNDPIEGYVKLYWQGDEAAWEGLFKNYICSLYRAIAFIKIPLPESKFLEQAVIVDLHQYDGMPIGTNLKEVTDILLKNASIQKIVSWLGKNEIKCSAYNLGGIFKLINETAYIICTENLKSKGFLSKDYPNGNSDLFIDNIFDRFPSNFFDQLSKFDPDKIKQAIIKLHQLLDSLDGHLEYVTIKSMQDKNDCSRLKMLYQLRYDFQAIYLKRLQELVYPKGYVVCFSKDNSNSVMWGNYADNHKGVCLIYETESKNGQEVMRLSRNGTMKNFSEEPLRPVKYGQPVIERNFFESLGGLTPDQIKSLISTHNRGISKLFDKYSCVEWRTQYWRDEIKKFHSKMVSWEYEHEYRLFADAAFHEYTPAEQNIKYDPTCLKGVVFGIKTSIEDKAKVLQAFRDANIANVEVYQSRYNDDTQSIDIIQRYRF